MGTKAAGIGESLNLMVDRTIVATILQLRTKATHLSFAARDEKFLNEAYQSGVTFIVVPKY